MVAVKRTHRTIEFLDSGTQFLLGLMVNSEGVWKDVLCYSLIRLTRYKRDSNLKSPCYEAIGPVGFRVRIGPRYALLVVRGD